MLSSHACDHQTNEAVKQIFTTGYKVQKSESEITKLKCRTFQNHFVKQKQTKELKKKTYNTTNRKGAQGQTRQVRTLYQKYINKFVASRGKSIGSALCTNYSENKSLSLGLNQVRVYIFWNMSCVEKYGSTKIIRSFLIQLEVYLVISKYEERIQ